MNSFGRKFRVSIFGESHGTLVGVTIDGVPAGIPLSAADLQADLDRRKAGAKGTTPRKEADEPHIICGLHNGRTCGAPLTAIIKNGDTRSKDYDKLRDESRIEEIGGHTDPAAIQQAIQEAIDSQDSLGGIISCTASGIPVGWGEPFFDSVESVLSHALFSIPAVKGVEFGAGFAAARMRGSQHNDPIVAPDGTTGTNNAGGINGGITNGNPIQFRIAVKPTSSIATPQQTYNFADGKVEPLVVRGRHDACIALRVPVIVEAMTALVLCDLGMVACDRPTSPVAER